MTTGLLLAALLVLGQGCGSIPQRNWQSYPHLTSDPTFRKWLIIKCTVEDDATVPPGLDQTIGFFFTVAGVATGNMIDYYSDVSYGAASFVGTTIVGWYPAPFKTTTTLKRRERALACANAIPDSDANDIPFEDYYGIVMMTNRLVDGGACYDAQQSLQIKDKSYNLACVSFDPESLFITFAAHEMGHGLGMPHSFDNTRDSCGGSPGEYCDKWDIMSALNVYTFKETNYVTPRLRHNTAGTGLDVPNLLQMGWIPRQPHRDLHHRRSRYQLHAERAEPSTRDRAAHGEDPGLPVPVHGRVPTEGRMGCWHPRQRRGPSHVHGRRQSLFLPVRDEDLRGGDPGGPDIDARQFQDSREFHRRTWRDRQHHDRALATAASRSSWSGGTAGHAGARPSDSPGRTRSGRTRLIITRPRAGEPGRQGDSHEGSRSPDATVLVVAQEPCVFQHDSVLYTGSRLEALLTPQRRPLLPTFPDPCD